MNAGVRFALEKVADAANDVVYYAQALQETLPPHESYEVPGEYIRALAVALADLDAAEEDRLTPPPQTPGTQSARPSG